MLEMLQGSTALSLSLAGAAAGGIAVATFLANLVSARSGRLERELSDARERLPEAARWEHLGALLRQRQEELEAVDDRLSALRQEVAESERAKIDAQQWRELADQAKRDYESLSQQRREVDQVRADHERALVDLAQARQELDDARTERSRVEEESRRLAEHVRTLEAKRDELVQLEAAIREKAAAVETLRAELGQVRDLREDYRAAEFGLREMERRGSSLEERCDSLKQEIGRLQEQRGKLEEELRPLADLRQDRDRIAREAEELGRRVEDLNSRRLGLEAVLNRLTDREQELRDTIAGLKAELEKLAEEVGRQKKGGSRAPAGDGLSLAEVVSDLKRRPAALFDAAGPLLSTPQPNSNERAALERVQEHLRELGLTFEPRVVSRFHACLKTGRISPLTVLAGISGTGKSQLPQRYAEAMGMHFLKIAVQPRWDSPQDLFGFYNYLEHKYRATDLARALIYMDPRGEPLLEDKAFIAAREKMRDHLLLVLLDEMNLARVEYYFSEFLSRLEGRPGPDEVNSDRIRASLIDIEAGVGDDHRLAVYPGHNTLFVGTMNEDESTQALSDKVLDRANVIRFPRPQNLQRELQEASGRYAEAHLPFAAWSAWHRPVSAIPPQTLDAAEKFVARLNEQLDRLRRPFGHRVNQAILSYVANHPDYQSPSGCKGALADVLELRVLPKLRGVEIDETAQQAFQRIAQLIGDEIDDRDLADSIKRGTEMSDTFDWIGRR